MKRIVEVLRRLSGAIASRWRSLSRLSKAYFTLLALIWAVTGVLAYDALATREISTVNAQNQGRLQSLKSDIANLPSMTTVKPSQTSGNIPHIVFTRSKLLSDIDAGKYAPKRASILYALHPDYDAGAPMEEAYRSYGELAKKTIRTTLDTARASRKFIEYTPRVDLASPLTSPDTAERLERTVAGLKKAQKAIADSDIPNAKTIGDALAPLIGSARTLDDGSKLAWADSILDVQSRLIGELAASDITSTDYASRLDGLTSLTR